jgi:hypothetical protein
VLLVVLLLALVAAPGAQALTLPVIPGTAASDNVTHLSTIPSPASSAPGSGTV